MRLKIFRKGKKEKIEEDINVKVENKVKLTELKLLCAEKPEIYEALSEFMFLHPEKIDVKLEDAVRNAEEFEKAGDTLRAAVWYRIAGGIALYMGDTSRVKQYLTKYGKLAGSQPKILNFIEEAVKKAQEYYSKHLEKGNVTT